METDFLLCKIIASLKVAFSGGWKTHMKVLFVLASVLFVAGCDSYDSFAECMRDYEARAASAHAVCPECKNDWGKLRRDAVKRCSKY